MDAGSHSSWRRRSSADGDTIYARPLGLTELGFYWDALFNGTADVVNTDTIKVVDPNRDPEQVFSKENVSRAWTELKRRYPLLGARIVADERHETVQFEVSDKYWTGEKKNGFSGTDRDLTFLDVGSAAEVYDFGNDLSNGPRQLSQDLLARLYVLRQRTDPRIYYVTFHIVHVITDGMANAALRRIFIDLIASGSPSMQYDIEDRLHMVRPIDALDPDWQLSAPRRRWKRAIGGVMAERRANALMGGHTLLRHTDAATPATPAKSCETRITLQPSVSARIMSTCRKNKFTFGHAHPVLGQVALARVLHRRRGVLSEEEWQWRRRQPMHNGGPLNLRPFLDREWLAKGGEAEAMLAISFFWHTLPFMPSLPEPDRDADGAQFFSQVMSRERFFYRCRLIKKQADGFLKHPLFLEIANARLPGRIERTRSSTLNWMKTNGTLTKELEDVFRNSPSMQSDGHTRPKTTLWDGLVITHGGSSMGNMDALVPLSYPLPRTHPLSSRQRAPRIQSKPVAIAAPPTVLTIIDTCTLLHCRPAELYLGASTSRDKLYMNVFWDGNVYDSDLVKEWLDEVKNAAVWYLGDAQLVEEMAKL
ncbi:hypothetical protein OE88DRAFT_1001759 [Heliocybe sulcata]|uniref:Condensation domain-containing protein n=1 Tax=Heliocybe sulcata TaxID=5364 RepID=A0A5C3NNA3_9AGAM|nr:hypothetical protein OE88DRAFT_1001759 [Heliocybe sulcata]